MVQSILLNIASSGQPGVLLVHDMLVIFCTPLLGHVTPLSPLTFFVLTAVTQTQEQQCHDSDSVVVKNDHDTFLDHGTPSKDFFVMAPQPPIKHAVRTCFIGCTHSLMWVDRAQPTGRTPLTGGVLSCFHVHQGCDGQITHI